METSDRPTSAGRPDITCLRRAIELDLVGMAVTTRTRQILDSNEALGRTLRYRRDDLIHRDWTELIHPDDRAADEAQFARVLDGEIDGYRLDTRLLCSDGHVVSAVIVVCGMRQPDGSIDQIMMLVQDITAQVDAATIELAHVVEMKDAFLASMSHELRTPLTAILGSAQLLREHIYGELSERQLRAIQRIEKGGQRLLQLIDDILDMALVNAGRLHLLRERLDIGELCEMCLSAIYPIAHQKHMTLQYTRDPHVTHMVADARRLKQMLVHLLTNAVKFTPDHGSVGLTVTETAESAAVCFTIWDTGIGITIEQQQRLFQPFVQLDGRLARDYEGSGLGLALVARLAHLHGGTITVESTPGLGSRFTVVLPS